MVVEIRVVFQQFPGDPVVVGVVQQHSFPGLVGRFAGAQHWLAAQAQCELQEPAPELQIFAGYRFHSGVLLLLLVLFWFGFVFSPNQVVFRSSQSRQILINISYGGLYMWFVFIVK